MLILEICGLILVEKNINSDSLLLVNSLKDALKIVSNDQKNLAANHLVGLSYQGLSLKVVTECLLKKTINLWAKITESLPSHLYNFVRKATQSQLPTLANLVRWGKTSSNLCPLLMQIKLTSMYSPTAVTLVY